MNLEHKPESIQLFILIGFMFQASFEVEASGSWLGLFNSTMFVAWNPEVGP